MRSVRSVVFACLICACGHSNATQTSPVATPTATASEAPAASSAAPAASATASTPEPSGMFCESGSPPMPTNDASDTRTGCWYQGTSCSGHGGHEGQQFKVTGTTVSAEFAHGGCSPGSYTLVYEPSTSPLKVRVCAKRAPQQKCNTVIRDGASWDVAPLLKANHATEVTIVKP